MSRRRSSRLPHPPASREPASPGAEAFRARIRAVVDLLDRRAFTEGADALRRLLMDAETARRPTGVVRYFLALALRDGRAAHHGNRAQTLEVLRPALPEPDCPAVAFTDVILALRSRGSAQGLAEEAEVLEQARRRFPADPLVAAFAADFLRARANQREADATGRRPDPAAVRAAAEEAFRVLEPFVDRPDVPCRVMWAIESAARATERLSVAQRTLRAIGAHPDFDLSELPALRCVEADVFDTMGLPADAAALFEEAIALAEERDGDALDASAAAHLSLAALAYRDGDPARAFGHVREVVMWRERGSFDVGNGVFLFRPGDDGPPELREAVLPGPFLGACAAGAAQLDVPLDLDPWIAAAAIVASEDGPDDGRLRPSTIATLVERAEPMLEDPARAVGVALEGAALWVGRHVALARDPARAEALGITPTLPPSGVHNGLVLPFPDAVLSPDAEERLHHEAVRVLSLHAPFDGHSERQPEVPRVTTRSGGPPVAAHASSGTNPKFGAEVSPRNHGTVA